MNVTNAFASCVAATVLCGGLHCLVKLAGVGRSSVHVCTTVGACFRAPARSCPAGTVRDCTPRRSSSTASTLDNRAKQSFDRGAFTPRGTFQLGWGRGACPCVACPSHSASDDASLPRLSTVPTRDRDAFNILALITFFPYSGYYTRKNGGGGSNVQAHTCLTIVVVSAVGYLWLLQFVRLESSLGVSCPQPGQPTSQWLATGR